MVIFRQNTEGLYCGVEWSHPEGIVYDALMSHKNFVKNFSRVPREEIAVSTRIFTRRATERILRAAFEHAAKNGYKSVTLCEKPNVIRETSGMMYNMAKAMQKEYAGIELWNTNIDAQMMWLTKNPEDYGVIVAGNMFGDIVSDGFAGLIGGLGFACSANLGSTVAVFEPTHGSAPKYADYAVPIVTPRSTSPRRPGSASPRADRTVPAPGARMLVHSPSSRSSHETRTDARSRATPPRPTACAAFRTTGPL